MISKINQLLTAESDQVQRHLQVELGPFAEIKSPADPLFPQTIDHTLLKPDATPAQIDELCDQARKYDFKAMACCVNSVNVPQVVARLAGTTITTCSVIGFPLGAGSTASKVFEAIQAIKDGAREIDMVINIGALKARLYQVIYNDIHAVVSASSPHPVKVIIETVFLTPGEKIAASLIAAEAGAAFVKTCTGFSGGAASPEDVRLMKMAVAGTGRKVSVKASAGIRSFEKCLEMIQAGADRIGTSSGVAIMENSAARAQTY
ncbi:hypothetical protein AMATHDRAFT_149434 [Amanita thiersii Skay4041]|uniref:deoxyribose-phosphate aldolase n=1 Tax=Amanita thiersii Skay4041 TaxID=703135 RepID=A0A2A9NK65_9AGAR|nr:hypothetical protein AMATHDRAFT_149434 [Amanita thiersii Skay4041]